MTQRILSLLVLAALTGTATAKLPPPDDAAKARAAETSARAAWQAKVDAFQLCKAQDRVAAKYRTGAKGDAKADAKATPVVAKAGAAAAPAANAPAAGTPTAAGAPAAAGTPTPAGSPAAAAPPAPCVEPGAFAYNPPEQKPLETAGAHSPTGTAASPPSVRPESAQMAPGKASGAPATTPAPAGAAPAGAAAPAAAAPGKKS